MATKSKTTIKRSSKNLKKKRGISKLQALILVGVLAVIGVVAVVLTRASGTPEYQYSWSKYCVAAHGSSSATEVAKCKDKSAESMVYRLYRGLFDKSPDVGGYKYWTQKLAGDRIKIVETGLVTSNVAKLGLAAGSTASRSSDTAFVKALYSNMLRREATDKEMTSWRDKLKATGSKKWSREKMIYAFAITGNAIDKNRDDFNRYATPDKIVTVVQNAANDQHKRFDAMLTDYQQPNKSEMNKADDLIVKAQSQLDAATTSAAKSQSTITAADVNNIAANQTAAQGYLAKAKEYAANSAKRSDAAKRLYDRANELAKFATDIKDNTVYGITKIGARYIATKDYAASTGGKPQKILDKVNSIASKYNSAKAKYDKEQARLAAAKKAADDVAKKAKDLAAAKIKQWVDTTNGNNFGTAFQDWCVNEVSFSIQTSPATSDHGAIYEDYEYRVTNGKCNPWSHTFNHAINHYRLVRL